MGKTGAPNFKTLSAQPEILEMPLSQNDPACTMWPHWSRMGDNTIPVEFPHLKSISYMGQIFLTVYIKNKQFLM